MTGKGTGERVLIDLEIPDSGAFSAAELPAAGDVIACYDALQPPPSDDPDALYPTVNVLIISRADRFDSLLSVTHHFDERHRPTTASEASYSEVHRAGIQRYLGVITDREPCIGGEKPQTQGSIVHLHTLSPPDERGNST